MNHQFFNVYNTKPIPRYAQTHYAADMYPRIPRNTPIVAAPAVRDGAMRVNPKIYHDAKNAPVVKITVTVSVMPMTMGVKKRHHPAHVNKLALNEYFDNIDAADKIAAAAWLKHVIAELERADAARRQEMAEFERDAILKYRAQLFADNQAKEQMIQDATAAYYAQQQEMRDRFMARHYGVKIK